MGTQLDQLPMAAAIFAVDGTLLEINPVAVALIGLPVEVLRGRNARELSASVEWDLSRVADGKVVTGEAELNTARGPIAISYAASMTVRDGVEVIQTYAIDLTATKAAHASDERASAQLRNESLGLVAGGIAHDFNNLLVGVLAEASAIADDVHLPDEIRDGMRRIETSAKRMAQLTRQLLAYSGRGRLVTSLIDPDAQLRDLGDAIARAVRGDVRVVVAPGAGTVAIEADPQLLRQVVLNLATNGSDAVGPEGRVEIASRVVMVDNAPWWQLEVADDGIGIDAATMARIFDPFFTTKIDRHGLGLSAVHGIVRRLGGHIDVASPAGAGARFHIRLPVVPGAEAPVTPRKLPAVSSPLNGVRVLIADDEPSVRSTVRRLFERRGAAVSVAADGAEAEALLRAQTFGFVLLDVEMPGRRGYELVPIARETQPGVPVLLMSGFTDTRGDVEPDGFLEKPFTSRALDAMIDELLARR